MISAGLPPFYIAAKLHIGINAVKDRIPGFLPDVAPRIMAARRSRVERIKAHIAAYPNVSLFPTHIWKHWS